MAPMGLDTRDVAAREGTATAPGADILQALDATAHQSAQQDVGILLEDGASHRGHGQDNGARDDPCMAHLTDLTDPVVDVHCGAAQAQRRLTTPGDPMRALPTMQTPICDRPHPLRITAGEHLVHEPVIGHTHEAKH
jgi:hypothetical protein